MSSRAKRKNLLDSIREDVKKREELAKTDLEVEWTMQALHFLRGYEGEHPILRSLARRSRDLRWVPTERQVIQIHRIAHREKLEVQNPYDSLGRRLRRSEGPDTPSSLDEPDWL